MSFTVRHEQAISGYASGHLTIASCALSDREAMTVGRLSDLSGYVPIDHEWESYLTLYPCGRFYAVAKTWNDPDCERRGCVVTHTILLGGIPTKNGLRCALGALRRPPSSLRGATGYDTAIDILSSPAVVVGTVEPHILEHLVFRETNPTAVVLWDDPPHETLAVQVWDSIAVEARSSLTLCTCAFNIRKGYDNEPFQMIIGPYAAASSIAYGQHALNVGFPRGKGRRT